MSTNPAPNSPQKSDPAGRMLDAAAARQTPPGTTESEEVLWRGGYSAKDMYGSWLLALLITIGAGVGLFMFMPDKAMAGMIFAGIAVVVWGGLGLVALYRKLNVYYELTNQRLTHKSGVLSRVTNRIEVIDVDDVTYTQGIVQRMLGVGTIKIISSDRSHPELWLRGIDDVQRVATLIDDVRRRERRARGLHIEAI